MKNTTEKRLVYLKSIKLLPLLKRLTWAFVINFVLLAGYIWIHIPLSSMTIPNRVTSVVSYKYDILAVHILVIISALIIRRIHIARHPVQIAISILSILILFGFEISSLELHSSSNLNMFDETLREKAFISFSGIPEDLEKLAQMGNFNPKGIFLSIKGLAVTLRELSWYWVVVPVYDRRYSTQNFVNIFLLVFCFATVITIVSGAVATLMFPNLGYKSSASPDTIPASSIFVQPYRSNRIYFYLRKRVRKHQLYFYYLLLCILICSLFIFGNSTFTNLNTTPIIWQSKYTAVPSYLRVRSMVSNENFLFIGTDGGVFRSEDKGQNWQQVNTGLFNTYIQSLYVNLSDGIIFAGTRAGLFITKNDGRNWQLVSNLQSSPWLISLNFDPISKTLFAGTNNNVLFSNDYGQTWQKILEDINTGSSFESLVINSQNNILFYARDSKIYRMQKDGQSWQTSEFDFIDKSIQAIIIDSKENLFVGTNKGLLHSQDSGNTWQTIEIGQSLVEVYALVSEPVSGVIFAGTNSGIFQSNDTGEWQPANQGLTNTVIDSLHLDQRNKLLIASTRGGVFRSQDMGKKWELIKENMTSISIKSLITHPKNGMFFAVTDSGVFRSQNGGQSWQATSAGMTSTDIGSLVVNSQGSILLANTYYDVFRSLDNGQTWEQSNNGLNSPFIRSIVIEPQTDIFFLNSQNGLFRSEDNGQTWQKTMVYIPERYTTPPTYSNGELIGSYKSTNLDIDSPLFNAEQDMLFALGRIEIDWPSKRGSYGINYDNNLFSSSDGGQSWHEISIDVRVTGVNSFKINPITGVLFAGTSNGIFRSQDDGKSWQLTSDAVYSSSLEFLSTNTESGVLFFKRGDQLYRSQDGGQSWQLANVYLHGAFRSRIITLSNNELLLVTDLGVFRSQDMGLNWDIVNLNFAGASTSSFVADPNSDILLSYSNTTMYRSQDGGYSWEPSSRGLSNTAIQSMNIRSQDGVVFVGTKNGISRSLDNGMNWVSTSAGLTELNIKSIIFSPVNNSLLAIAAQKVFVSLDGGESWKSTVGLNGSILSLIVDHESQRLFCKTDQGIYQSTDNGESWEMTSFFPMKSFSVLSGNKKYLVLFDQINNIQLLDTHSLFGLTSIFGRTNLAHSMQSSNRFAPIGQLDNIAFVTSRLLSENEVELQTSWGNTIGYVRFNLKEFATNESLWHQLQSVCYTLVSALFFDFSYFSASIGTNFLFGWVLFIPSILIGYISLYNLWGAPYKITLLRFMQAIPWKPNKLVLFAQVGLQESLQVWSYEIRKSLLWGNDVITDDLLFIPLPYRRWSLHKYWELNKENQPLEKYTDQLRLLAGSRPGELLVYWRDVAQKLHQAPGMPKEVHTYIDRMSQVLCNALRFRLSDSISNWTSMRGYKVDLHSLRLNVPPTFPLIFLADPRPSIETIKLLTDYVNTLNQTSYFALVVVLESLTREVDIVVELRQSIRAMSRVNDFILLTLDDVLDILSSRDPIQTLAKKIVEQVDLKTISPFIDSGPCPPNMFFGREREIKQIVEGVQRSDFAVIGNRKAGKTSLLQRVHAQLVADIRFHPIDIDCQNVTNIVDFCRAFENRSGLTLREHTPNAFSELMRSEKKIGLTNVFLLDEVDELLKYDLSAAEKLSRTWRMLAAEGVCHFVFVGTTVLAQSIRNPNSAYFNFVQAMPLKYLTPDIAKAVIIEPMHTLGLILDPEDEVLNRIVDLTSGHPNLLQSVGRRLVEQVNLHQIRVITPKTCESIAHQNSFAQFYLDVVWGSVNPREKLITLVAPREDFDINEIEQALEEHGIFLDSDEISHALEMLDAYAFLRKEGKQYIINPRHFRAILNRTEDTDRLIKSEKRRLNK